MPYDSPTVSPEMKARLDAIKERGFAPDDKYRVTGYPEEVTETLNVVCELWNLRAPNTKKQKGFWIDGARDLLDACGEYGVECIRAYRVEFEAHMRANGGLAPHTVASPMSLVNMVRAKAATMRQPVMLSAEAAKEIRLRERMERERNEE